MRCELVMIVIKFSLRFILIVQWFLSGVNTEAISVLAQISICYFVYFFFFALLVSQYF